MRESDVYLISEYNLYNLLQFSSMHILGMTMAIPDAATRGIMRLSSCEIFKRRNPRPFVNANVSIRAGSSL